MKTVGIIGGLGPQTTAHFYLRVITASLAVHKTQRPEMLIWNTPCDISIERNFVKHGRGKLWYEEHIIIGAKKLERAGADFIVIPCNTVHEFIDHIRSAVHIPVISIIEETVLFLHQNNIRAVGILGTSTTVKNGLFQKPLERQKIQIGIPSGQMQKQIDQTICRLVNRKKTERDTKIIKSAINGFLKKHISTILLACTDLQLAVTEEKSFQLVDTFTILVNATVKQIHTKNRTMRLLQEKNVTIYNK